MSSHLRLSRIHFPVDVLGPGRRVGIWLQGCTLACPGCLSRDTWDGSAGTLATVDEVVQVILDRTSGADVDGVTISGGEPFQQPEALRSLIPRLRRALHHRAPEGGVDVLSYSGLSEAYLRSHHADVLAELDALIPEPYAAGAGIGERWRGSANQPLVILSELGSIRFADIGECNAGGEMQLAIEDGVAWMIGIPQRGDLRRLERLLEDRGIRLWQSSWRP